MPIPLSSRSDGDHVHGDLRLEIGGRLVSRLDYLHPDNVCVAKAFSKRTARYVYDEGEEGQPAFIFERSGDLGFFSIVDSKISERIRAGSRRNASINCQAPGATGSPSVSVDMPQVSTPQVFSRGKPVSH